jgi:hypothetical protein
LPPGTGFPHGAAKRKPLAFANAGAIIAPAIWEKTMQLADYQDRYQCLHFARDPAGVLEVRMHTRGGPALWGTSLNSLHAELGQAFLDIARDAENRLVIPRGAFRPCGRASSRKAKRC